MSGGPVVAIINPVARGAAAAERALQAGLAERGQAPAVVLPTTAEGFGAPEARRALAMGAGLVVAGGGDGTVRAIAEVLRGSGVPLAVLPLGTANIFARNLGLAPGRTRAVARLAQQVRTGLDGPQRAVDLGLARVQLPPVVGSTADEVPTVLAPGATEPPAGVADEHVFFVLAGIGRDALTVLGVDPRVKKYLGWLAYFVAGLRQMSGSPVGLGISCDGAPVRQERLWSLLVGNAGRIPGGLELFRDGRLDDGLLHTLEVSAPSWRAWARIAAQGLARWRAQAPGLVHGSARRVVVEPAQPLPVQLDGDVLGPVSRVELWVEPGALLVRAPRR